MKHHSVISLNWAISILMFFIYKIIAESMFYVSRVTTLWLLFNGSLGSASGQSGDNKKC